jgi:hypothetical protein
MLRMHVGRTGVGECRQVRGADCRATAGIPPTPTPSPQGGGESGVLGPLWRR